MTKEIYATVKLNFIFMELIFFMVASVIVVVPCGTMVYMISLGYVLMIRLIMKQH